MTTAPAAAALSPPIPAAIPAPIPILIPARMALWIGLGGIAAAALLMVVQIQNNPSFSFPDELGRLLVAREAWRRPSMLFNGWGRTGNTLTLMPVALFSLSAARLWMAAIGLGTIALAWSFAARAGMRLACLVPWLIALQPQYLETGWGAIPQTPAGLLLIGTLWLAQRGRWRSAALAAGLLPLVRFQALSLAAAFAAVCLYRRRPYPALLTALPLAAVSLAAWLTVGRIPILYFFLPQPTLPVDPEPLPEFLLSMLHQFGPLILILAIIGLLEAPRRSEVLLLAAIYGLYHLVHYATFRLNLSPAANYLVFLTPLIPGIAVMAALGADVAVMRIFDSVADSPLSDPRHAANWPRRAYLERCAVATIVLTAAISTLSNGPLTPRELNPVGIDIDRAVDFLHARGLQNREIVSASARFYYKMPYPFTDSARQPGVNTRPLDAMTSGTLVVWDERSATRFGLPFGELIRPGTPWRKIWTSPTVRIFEKLSVSAPRVEEPPLSPPAPSPAGE